MSGQLQLTTTTKVGSVQPAVLGGATGPLGGAKSTCWHHRCDTRPSTGVIMASPKATAAKIYLTRWFFTSLRKESALPIGDIEAADQDVVGGGQDVRVRGEGGGGWGRAQQARGVGGCTYPLPGPGSRSSEV